MNASYERVGDGEFDVPVSECVVTVAPPIDYVKPKRVNKKTREALAAEFARGYAEAMDRDRGMEMIGSLGLALICAALGVGFGAWLF